MKREEMKNYISLCIFEIIERVLYHEDSRVEDLFEQRERLHKEIREKINDYVQSGFFDMYILAVKKRIATKTVHFFVEGLKNADSAFLLFNYETQTNTRIFDELENQLLRGFKMDFAQYSKLKDINKKYEDIVSFSAYKNCDTIVKTLSDLYK